jgi:hypothetical protein
MFSGIYFQFNPHRAPVTKYVQTMCGGGGGGDVECVGDCRSFTSICDQIQKLQNCFPTPLKKNLGGEGSLKQINSCRKGLL